MFHQVASEFLDAVVDFVNALTVPHSLDDADW